MSVTDFFVHAIFEADEEALFDLSGADLEAMCDRQVSDAHAHGINRSVIHFFDERVLDRPEQSAFLAARSKTDELSFFTLLSPDTQNPDERVEAALRAGMRGICFHPYLQRITSDVYPSMAALAERASAAGLIVGICSAYGSQSVFEITPLESVVACAKVCTGPVVVLHGGGAKILDAIVIANAFPNVYLETSFSLLFWDHSSVEMDFAAAVRKLGANRILFGSDAPFCDRAKALSAHHDFFERHNIPADDRAVIMGSVANELLKD